MRTWSYELQERSVKFLIESSMGFHDCECICLCHISGIRGFIQSPNAYNHSWIIQVEEEGNSLLKFSSAVEIIKAGWIVEGV